MSKLFKVYAQCAKSARPYQEIEFDDLKEYINEVVNDGFENGYIDFSDEWVCVPDDVMGMAYEKVKAHFDRVGVLNCGDYEIVKAGSIDELTRPNMCGWDTDIIFS